jgi:hypothetical protein
VTSGICVIPVQAGIQQDRMIDNQIRILACAGMTENGMTVDIYGWSFKMSLPTAAVLLQVVKALFFNEPRVAERARFGFAERPFRQNGPT